MICSPRTIMMASLWPAPTPDSTWETWHPTRRCCHRPKQPFVSADQTTGWGDRVHRTDRGSPSSRRWSWRTPLAIIALSPLGGEHSHAGGRNARARSYGCESSCRSENCWRRSPLGGSFQRVRGHWRSRQADLPKGQAFGYHGRPTRTNGRILHAGAYQPADSSWPQFFREVTLCTSFTTRLLRGARWYPVGS